MHHICVLEDQNTKYKVVKTIDPDTQSDHPGPPGIGFGPRNSE